MKIIGLTGGIASGKSTVARFLEEFGAVIIDADQLGHDSLKPDTETWHEVVDVFGQSVLNDHREVDRKKLGELVFNNPEALARLNKIVHPHISKAIQDQLEEYRRKGVKVVVIEIPLLVETGGISMVDQVWVITAPKSVVLSHLQERSGLSWQQSLARINSQISNAERVRHADVVIDNSSSLDVLKSKVKESWSLLFDTI
jgi:dephospho-CoA kinase